MRRRAWWWLAVLVLPRPTLAQDRIGDLATVAQETPRQLMGYSLVVGLEGTGDGSFGSSTGATHTVQSVVNLLNRFGISVPARVLRLRNVAAVLVTAEVSPYLRAGGQFHVHVASVGDATSLRGGVLWQTALLEGPEEPVTATAQGVVVVAGGDERFRARGGTTGRIPDGGLVVTDPPTIPPTDSVMRLLLKRPSVGNAMRITDAINAAFGDGTAALEDPGAIRLQPAIAGADNQFTFLAAIDTIRIEAEHEARLVVDAHSGTVVAGGGLTVGPAVVSHRGITLAITADATSPTATAPGLVAAVQGATVQEIAAGLHAAGARPDEIGSIFEALRDVGALTATVVIR